MKKILALLATLALGCGLAFGQGYSSYDEDLMFNHLSVGIGLLGTDGNSIVVAAPIGQYVQVRAGFTTQALEFAAANAITKKIPEVGPILPFTKDIAVGVQYNNIKIDNLSVSATPKSNNLELLFDIYPGKKTSFHFTVGSYFCVSAKGLVSATATPSRNDGQSVFSGFDKPNDVEFFDSISADPNGKFHFDLQWRMKVVRPYVGIGFGRPVNMNRRVGVNFDMGVAYLGGAHMVGYSYYDDPNKPKAVSIDQKFIDDKILTNPDLSEQAKQEIRDIKTYLNEVDKYSKFYPVLKLTLFVRLF